MDRIHSSDDGFFIPATMNTMLGYGLFLNEVAAIMELGAKAIANRNDRVVVQETVTRARYTALLFSDILNVHGDEVSEEFDYSKDMSEVVKVAEEMLKDCKVTMTISISSCIRLNELYREIAYRYHTPTMGRRVRDLAIRCIK